MSGSGNNLGLHDFGDDSIVIHRHQVFGRDDSNQLSAFQNIAGIDGFFVDADLFDVCHSLFDSHGLVEGDIFGCHNAAGAVLRIIQQKINAVSLAAVHCIENAGDKIGRKLFEKIHSIIHI